MKPKLIFGLLLGFVFAAFVMPIFANMTLAAKYRKTGALYADDQKKSRTPTICTSSESGAASIIDAVSKIKCRTPAGAN